MTRYRLVPLAETKALLDLAERKGIVLANCGLDVGRDYVRLIPPSSGSDSVDAYIDRAAHSPKKAGAR